MSELIQKQHSRPTVRLTLLTGVSALALTVSSAMAAKAEDGDRPTVWIELGGQLEMMQGIANHPFTSPFMTALTPTPEPYRDDIFAEGQKPPHFSVGFDGKISFQPKDSEWTFLAAIRYGRSQSKRHIHHQTRIPTISATTTGGYRLATHPQTSKVADVGTPFDESHTIVDFQVGKDVGLGLFGREGASNVNIGVRIAQFSAKSSVDVKAIPGVAGDLLYISKYNYYAGGLNRLPFLELNFRQYYMRAHEERSFRGIGPSLSWNASAVVAGSPEESELSLDWSINAAVLFGRQRAKIDHTSGGYHNFFTVSSKYLISHHVVSPPNTGHSTRSRNITVPNIGGSMGISLKWPNAKLSFGYRADYFFGATDTGIDTTRRSNLGFNGPYASISVGLGG